MEQHLNHIADIALVPQNIDRVVLCVIILRLPMGLKGVFPAKSHMALETDENRLLKLRLLVLGVSFLTRDAKVEVKGALRVLGICGLVVLSLSVFS